MTRKSPKTNPNGANQHVIDPRQALFLGFFLDPKSQTFSNCLQSAIKAGYSQEYSENLSAKMPDWLADKVCDNQMIAQAEKNLNYFLAMKAESDVGRMRVKADITKFVAERLIRAKYGRDDLPEAKPPVQVNVIVNQQASAIIKKAEDDLKKVIEGEIAKKDE